MEPEETVDDTPLSETVLCVRFTGHEDFRIMRRSDLSQDFAADNASDELRWTPNSELPYSEWLDYAGTEERALEVLKQNAHEFQLVGPGAEDVLGGADGEEEFEIGGPVE
jgi:hypothetical protein